MLSLQVTIRERVVRGDMPVGWHPVCIRYSFETFSLPIVLAFITIVLFPLQLSARVMVSSDMMFNKISAT